jgi:hypothetical protein
MWQTSLVAARRSLPGGGEKASFQEDAVDRLRLTLARDVRACTSLEAAARAAVTTLYYESPLPTVLVRAYATVAFRDLPPVHHAFADAMAKRGGRRPDLRPDTSVLVLLATRGTETEQNTPQSFVANLAMPLTDATFVRSVPMVASLLESLGASAESFDRAPSSPRRGGRGVYYVPDATERSEPAVFDRAFVHDQGVRTVFGLGGVYLTGAMLALVAFTRELVPLAAVERLAVIADDLKAATYRCVSDGRIFEV